MNRAGGDREATHDVPPDPLQWAAVALAKSTEATPAGGRFGAATAGGSARKGGEKASAKHCDRVGNRSGSGGAGDGGGGEERPTVSQTASPRAIVLVLFFPDEAADRDKAGVPCDMFFTICCEAAECVTKHREHGPVALQLIVGRSKVCRRLAQVAMSAHGLGGVRTQHAATVRGFVAKKSVGVGAGAWIATAGPLSAEDFEALGWLEPAMILPSSPPPKHGLALLDPPASPVGFRVGGELVSPAGAVRNLEGPFAIGSPEEAVAVGSTPPTTEKLESTTMTATRREDHSYAAAPASMLAITMASSPPGRSTAPRTDTARKTPAGWSPRKATEALIVLGNMPVDMVTPSVDTVARVEAAVAYAHDKPQSVVLFTGGKTGAGPHVASEALMMAIIARSLGLDRPRMLMEQKAASTTQNAALSFRLLHRVCTRVTAVVVITKREHLEWALPRFHKLEAPMKNAIGLPVDVPRSAMIDQLSAYLKMHKSATVRRRLQNLRDGVKGVD